MYNMSRTGDRGIPVSFYRVGASLGTLCLPFGVSYVPFSGPTTVTESIQQDLIECTRTDLPSRTCIVHSGLNERRRIITRTGGYFTPLETFLCLNYILKIYSSTAALPPPKNAIASFLVLSSIGAVVERF